MTGGFYLSFNPRIGLCDANFEVELAHPTDGTDALVTGLGWYHDNRKTALLRRFAVFFLLILLKA